MPSSCGDREGNVLLERCRALFDQIRTILSVPGTVGRKRRRSGDKVAGTDAHSDKRRRHERLFPNIKALCPAHSSPPSTEPACTTIDQYLATIPSVVERATELHSRPVRILSNCTTPNSKIINVLQGEIAHATAVQADIIVSDRATTCHIVAVRSTPIDDVCGDALVSLCHIDKVGYEDCLRGMVQLHKAHHNTTSDSTDGEEKKESDEVAVKKVKIDLHIVGGYADPRNSSLAITEYLIDLFGRCALEERDAAAISVETCAVSCMNDNGSGAPIGRGLALDLHSGAVYLASVDPSVAGPAVELRNSRIWAGASDDQRLNVIHSATSNVLTVEPFDFYWTLDLDEILDLSDEDMLLETSTSPDAEEGNYCDHVRASLRCLRDNSSEELFGSKCCTPLRYSRSKANEWRADA